MSERRKKLVEVALPLEAINKESEQKQKMGCYKSFVFI